MAQDEHLAAEVGSDNRRTAPAGVVVRQCQVGRAGATVQHRDTRHGRDDPRRERSPGTIDVETEQMVKEIVPPRDRAEHPPHPLVGLVDRGGALAGLVSAADPPRPSFRPDWKHSFWKPRVNGEIAIDRRGDRSCASTVIVVPRTRWSRPDAVRTLGSWQPRCSLRKGQLLGEPACRAVRGRERRLGGIDLDSLAILR